MGNTPMNEGPVLVIGSAGLDLVGRAVMDLQPGTSNPGKMRVSMGGDALSAAVIFALLNEIPLDEAIRLGVSAATLTLRSTGTVSAQLSLERLYDELR